MHLVVDVSNLCWIKRFGHLKSKKKELYAKQLILQESLNQIFKIYKYYGCSNLVLAFDGGNLWRKQKYQYYKATREIEYDLYFDEVKEVISSLYQFFDQHTNCYSLMVSECEADDIISTVVGEVDESVIMSTDGDFVQLLGEGTRIYDPIKKTEKEVNDPEYELFLKCIRGDRGDNILSAFPRVRETKIQEAYNNSYQLMNMMNETRKDGQIVGDVYEFNRDLIDLSRVPSEYVKKIKDEIRNKQDESNKYNYVNVIRYFRDLELKDYVKNHLHNHVFILKRKKDII